MKNALLITSCQNDLLSPEGKAWGMTKDSVVKNNILRKLRIVIDTARQANMLVIHSPVSFDYEKLKDFTPKSAMQSVIVSNQLLEADSNGAKFVQEAMPMTGDIVLPPRQGFSSFWANTIQPYLDDYKINTVFIAGMLAEGCIESHSRDAVENGYSPVVLSDVIGSTSSDLLEASLKTLGLHALKLITGQQFVNQYSNNS